MAKNSLGEIESKRGARERELQQNGLPSNTTAKSGKIGIICGLWETATYAEKNPVDNKDTPVHPFNFAKLDF